MLRKIKKLQKPNLGSRGGTIWWFWCKKVWNRSSLTAWKGNYLQEDIDVFFYETTQFTNQLLVLLFYYFLSLHVCLLFVVQTLRTAALFASVSAGCSSGSRGSFPSRTSSRCGRWDCFLTKPLGKHNICRLFTFCFPPQVLWTRLPCDNFHLLIACSILESQRGELIGSDHDFNTILKVKYRRQVDVWVNMFSSSSLPTDPQHINELTMKLDLQAILCEAEAIYQQLVCCKVRRRALIRAAGATM